MSMGHLFDMNAERLVATACSLGVKIIHIRMPGIRGQHIILGHAISMKHTLTLKKVLIKSGSDKEIAWAETRPG